MKGLACFVGCAVVSLVLGCSSSGAEEGVDEGAVEGAVTRCGPPTAPRAAREQSRCVEPTDVEEAEQSTLVVTSLEGEGEGGYSFFIGVHVRGSKLYNVFADTKYRSLNDAAEGARALLRVGLDAKSYSVAEEEGRKFVRIRGANNVTLARTTYVKDGDLKRVMNSVRKSIAKADLSGLPLELRAGWRGDYRARTFKLIAGNNQPMLESDPVAGDDNAFHDAIFGTHELVAAEHANAIRIDKRGFCSAFDMGPTDGWPLDNIRVYKDGSGFRYDIYRPSTTEKPLVRSATQFTSCEGAVEGVQRVTDLLQRMPRG